MQTPPSSRRHFLKKAAYAGGGIALASAGLNAASPYIWNGPIDPGTNLGYWNRSHSAPNPPLTTDLRADVAIIGGGLTGLSAAYFIRKLSPTRRVIVLETKGCGNGASGRNGGMVLTMTEDRYMQFSADPAVDKQIYDLTAQNLRFLAELSSSFGMDCELDTNGALQVFNTAENAKDAHAYVQKARTLEMPVEFWNPQQLANAIGTHAYEGAFFDPAGGHLHPMKLVNLFKAAAESVGAEIYENTGVVHVDEGLEHVLHTHLGNVVRAKSLVLATNAYPPRLGHLRNSIVPVQEFVAITPPLSSQQLDAIGWRQRIPFNDSRTEVFYLGLTRDNRIHIGGGAPSYFFNGNAPGASASRPHIDALRRELVRIYPQLDGISFEVTWDGLVDWSLDVSPSVGQTGRHNNIFYGIGYSGHGVNLTSIFGRIIADLEATRGEPWRHFPFVNARLEYVPNEPFRWLAAKCGLAWYRLTGS